MLRCTAINKAYKLRLRKTFQSIILIFCINYGHKVVAYHLHIQCGSDLTTNSFLWWAKNIVKKANKWGCNAACPVMMREHARISRTLACIHFADHEVLIHECQVILSLISYNEILFFILCDFVPIFSNCNMCLDSLLVNEIEKKIKDVSFCNVSLFLMACSRWWWI